MNSNKFGRIFLFGIAIVALASAILLIFSTGEGTIDSGMESKDGNSLRSPHAIIPVERDRNEFSKKAATRNDKRSGAEPLTASPATINVHGFISASIIDLAGLTKEETNAVQSLFNEHRDSMRKLIQKNMNADDLRSDPDLGIRAFVIKPFASDGEAEYGRLVSGLDSTIGQSKRNLILQGCPDTEFFSYGKTEVLVRLFCGDAAGNLLAPDDDKTGIRTMTRVEVVRYDPVTGKTAGRSSSDIESLKEAVGDIFGDIDL
ncbi:MAG: hypothetical protein K9N23_10450 [Akkermansiaceae bacterium]|nr:hypothetical protein [Akkermansiaceae bacterium]MCF7732101.1 hypothetical protein [Akkermansiaceae bacterium]